MTKVFLNYSQQIAELELKNLIIEDTAFAERVLIQVGYFPLIVAYKSSFKNPTTKMFRDGTKIEDIFALYEFDECLRNSFLASLLRFERAIKAQITYTFCEAYGEQQSQYLNNQNYDYNGRKCLEIDEFINKHLDPLVNKSNSYPYITHHRNTYNNVPLWVTVNALTFGNISKMFSFLPQSLQSRICKNYPLLPNEMVKILSVVTKFRNVCAHGERFFLYRTRNSIPDLLLHKSMKIPHKGSQFIYGKQDVFAVFLAMRYLLPKYEFHRLKKNIAIHVASFASDCDALPEKDLLYAMGFPENWKTITRFTKLR